MEPDESGNWHANFNMPGDIAGRPLLAELRTLPAGNLAVVQLGEVPRLLEQLESGITAAWWDEAKMEVILTAVITHTGAGDVYIGSDFIQLLEGGDAHEFSGQVTPSLPFLIHPGETVGITVTFLPQAPSVRDQIGADLWEITDIPTGMSLP
jgi:hypothetical protein